MELQITFNTTLNFNTTLQFKCDAGFTLPDMYEGYRICQDNEVWSGSEPTCTGKYMGHARGKLVFGVYAVSGHISLCDSIYRTYSNMRKSLHKITSVVAKTTGLLKICTHGMQNCFNHWTSEKCTHGMQDYF